MFQPGESSKKESAAVRLALDVASSPEEAAAIVAGLAKDPEAARAFSDIGARAANSNRETRMGMVNDGQGQPQASHSFVFKTGRNVIPVLAPKTDANSVLSLYEGLTLENLPLQSTPFGQWDGASPSSRSHLGEAIASAVQQYKAKASGQTPAPAQPQPAHQHGSSHSEGDAERVTVPAQGSQAPAATTPVSRMPAVSRRPAVAIPQERMPSQPQPAPAADAGAYTPPVDGEEGMFDPTCDELAAQAFKRRSPGQGGFHPF